MFLSLTHRPSPSPLIDRIWRCHSTHPGTLLSVAATHCELVLTRHQGRLRAGIQAKASRAIDLHQGDRLQEPALRDLIRAAVALNKKPSKPKSRRKR